MINSKYLVTIVMKFRFEIKPETKGSFYKLSGCGYIPNRISYSKDDLSPVKNVGRASSLIRVGSFIGRFTERETSKIKFVKGGVIRGRIFAYPNNPRILEGVGELSFVIRFDSLKH